MSRDLSDVPLLLNVFVFLWVLFLLFFLAESRYRVRLWILGYRNVSSFFIPAYSTKSGT